MTTQTLLMTHIGLTFFMTGVIWYVQLVHYPLFSFVVRSQYERFQADHEKRTGFIVVPVMLVELVTGIGLLFVPPDDDAGVLLIVNAGLLGLIWFSTFFLQVPRHRTLATGFNVKEHNLLVKSNWVRTLGWTIRSVLLMRLIT